MQVKVSPVEYRDEAAARTLAAAFKPARLNFAQVCLWCGVRWCESPVCVEMWTEALWGPCGKCDGFGSLVSCLMCVNGVVEITREGAHEDLTRTLLPTIEAFDAQAARRTGTAAW